MMRISRSKDLLYLFVVFALLGVTPNPAFGSELFGVSDCVDLGQSHQACALLLEQKRRRGTAEVSVVAVGRHLFSYTLARISPAQASRRPRIAEEMARKKSRIHATNEIVLFLVRDQYSDLQVKHPNVLTRALLGRSKVKEVHGKISNGLLTKTFSNKKYAVTLCSAARSDLNLSTYSLPDEAEILAAYLDELQRSVRGSLKGGRFSNALNMLNELRFRERWSYALALDAAEALIGLKRNKDAKQILTAAMERVETVSRVLKTRVAELYYQVGDYKTAAELFRGLVQAE